MILDWKIIALFLVGILMWWFFFLSMAHAAQHQRGAMPLHEIYVIISGILAVVCMGGGIVAIVVNTELRILGAQLTTAHVGIVLLGIGLAIAFFTVRAVLRNQRGLAGLPRDKGRKDSGK